MQTIAAKMTSALSSNRTGQEKSGNWSASNSRKDRSINRDNKAYYELDERSLIGKGAGGTSFASATAVKASASNCS